MALRRPPPDVLHELEQLLVPGLDGELIGFLEDRERALVEALGISHDELQGLRDDEQRMTRLRELITRARKARKDRYREQRTQLAIAAAGMLSRLAHWSPERIELSSAILLGQSLVPPGARWVRLAPEGRKAVIVPASRLRAAGRVLRKRDHVYHPASNGSFSLKSVYPALVGRDGYDGLDVADGGTASVELERLMFDTELGEDERERIRSSLLEYCGMDTQALVELVERLRSLSR